MKEIYIERIGAVDECYACCSRGLKCALSTFRADIIYSGGITCQTNQLFYTSLGVVYVACSVSSSDKSIIHI